MAFQYSWYRGDSATGPWKLIPRARLAQYTASGADVGKYIRRGVTNHVAGKGITTAYSAAVGPIAAPTTGGGGGATPDFLPSVARVRDRIAFGGPLDEAEITSMGVQAFIERALDPRPMADAEARKYSSWPVGFGLSEYPLTDDLGPQPLDIARMAGSRNALKQNQCEFWNNHLVPGYKIRNTGRLPSLMSLNEVFFNEGLGNFEKLLKRFIMSVPLQYFMDNWLNVYGDTNENLGREILELFALGIGEEDEPPHYDQTLDVYALTNILTGHGVKTFNTLPQDAGKLIDNDPRHRRGAITDYTKAVVVNADGTIDHNRMAQTAWFDPTKHDPDAQTFTFLKDGSGNPIVFSNAIDGPGVEGYEMHPSLTKFCRLITRHRPAARFLCTKLARWYLGCNPTVATREKMMDTWIAAADAPDQIAQTLRVLFFSEDFCTDYAKGRRALWPTQYYSKILNYFGESYGSKRNVAWIKGYCEKEDFQIRSYQTPAGFEDTPDYIASPGHITERGFRGQSILVNNKSLSADFSVDYTAYCAARGFTTPRQLLNDVAHYWFCDRATPAQMATLEAIFGSSIDTTTNWDTDTNRGRVRDVYRAAMLIDLTHFAA